MIQEYIDIDKMDVFRVFINIFINIGGCFIPRYAGICQVDGLQRIVKYRINKGYMGVFDS